MPLPTAAEAEARFAPPLPPQIAARAAQGDALHEEYIRSLSGAPAPEQPQGEEPSAPPADEAAPPPPAQEPPAQAEPPQPPQQEIDWKRRFEQAENARLSAQGRLDPLIRRVADLERLIAGINATQPAPPPPAAPAPLPNASLTPEDEQNFGKDLIDVIQRAAHDVAARHLQPIEQKINGLGERVQLVGSAMQSSAVDQLRSSLTAAIPDWRQQNNDPGFLQWLAEVDPYAGRTRQEMLREAWAGHDAQRVITFFQGYRSEISALDPQRQQANPAAAGKPSLEKFAAPGKATSAAPPSPTAKPIYTRADITRFYADVQRGVYKGREADYSRIERDIFAAQREGRIRN